MGKYKFKEISKKNSVAISIEFAKYSMQVFEYDRTDSVLDRTQQKLKYFVNSFETAYKEINDIDDNTDF